MPENDKIEVSGPTIGSLFANTVNDVRKGVMPLRMSASIDLRVSFAAVEMSKKGWNLIYVKQSETNSTLKVELATRIHSDGLNPPRTEELITFVQGRLIATGAFKGKADGKRTADLDKAIDVELAAYVGLGGADLPPRIKSWKTSKARFVGLLQILLGLQASDCDGYYGPNTETAFVLRGIDYSLPDFETA